MNCGYRFRGDPPEGGYLRFDAICAPPLYLSYDGQGNWTHFCSPWCAAFGRHVDSVRVTCRPEIADVEVKTR